jgi:hypothetical protein
LQPILPHGFDSWTQVLTDSGISRAFPKSSLPHCFKDRPELAAPFVAEIGAAIREKTLVLSARKIALLHAQVTEPAYDQVGGSAYLETRRTMEAAQERYLADWRARRSTLNNLGSPEFATLQLEKDRAQAAFHLVRRRHEPFVQETQAEAARAYWSTHRVRGIPDTFFADAAPSSAAARMQRIHPPWWGTFMGRLQEPLAHGHLAEGYFLDALPRLRAMAIKKTLAAMIEEWQQENAQRWGWYGPVYYRMLASRAADKADKLTHWFNARAPGYLTDKVVRRSLHAELAKRLAAADPWSLPTPERQPAFFLSEHGLN